MHICKCWSPARAEESEIALRVSYRHSLWGTEEYVWRAVLQCYEVSCYTWEKLLSLHFGCVSASFVVLVQTLHSSGQLACLQMSWQRPGAHQQLCAALPKCELTQAVLFAAVACQLQATELSSHESKDSTWRCSCCPQALTLVWSIPVPVST